jgi:hypothetical protein
MNWAKKVLWFIFGAVATVLLMSVSTSRAVEPRQTLEQRVIALEYRVASLEAANAAETKERREQQRENSRRDPGERHNE